MNEKDFQEIMRMQQMMSQRIMREQTVNRKVDVLTIINDMAKGSKKQLQVESIVIEAGYNGIEENDVMRILDELADDKLISFSGTGYIRLI
jgi:DNA replicative helicase MCM subunit Mcm2 (Cdc46/Mcm family)